VRSLQLISLDKDTYTAYAVIATEETDSSDYLADPNIQRTLVSVTPDQVVLDFYHGENRIHSLMLDYDEWFALSELFNNIIKKEAEDE
jgi:hypothetical protein